MTKKKTEKDIVSRIENDIGLAVEKVTGPAVKEKLEKEKKKVPYLYISIIFIIVIVGVFAYSMLRTQGVQIGDKIRVTYTGTFENGTNFDDGSIEFRIGENQMIQGFEYGVIGMKEGEQKKITVKPRYAYGDWSTENLEVMNATYKTNRWFDIKLDEAEKLTEDDIKIGNLVNLKNNLWPSKVTDIDEEYEEARFEHMPVEDSIYYNPLLSWWPLRVVEIQETEIVLRHEPKIDTKVIKNTGKTGKVITADEEQIVIDYNHPMAGKTLIFDVKIEKIIRS